MVAFKSDGYFGVFIEEPGKVSRGCAGVGDDTSLRAEYTNTEHDGIQACRLYLIKLFIEHKYALAFVLLFMDY